MATGDDLADLKIVMKEFIADLRHIFMNIDEQRDLASYTRCIPSLQVQACSLRGRGFGWPDLGV